MELTFRQATTRDIPEMMALWRLCFPEDEEAFVRHFFAEIPIECAVVGCKADVLVMAFLLPAEVCIAGESHPVRYLYAGGTHPDHRGQGIYKKLLQFAAEFVGGRGESAIYLHPASPSLAAYYEKCGYRPGIGGWHTTSIPETTFMLKKQLTVSEYLTARKKFFPSDLPLWQLTPPVDRFFVDLLIEDGWQPFTERNGCGLLSPDQTQVYDAIGIAPAVPAFGANPAGTWQDTAWWIPTDNKLLSLLVDKPAYTAFLGDF